MVATGITWAIIWLSRDQRWSRLVDIFHRMNIGIFVCVLCVFIVGQVIMSLRWWLLLRTQSIYIGLWAAVKLNFLGWFYNNFMPGSVGGDLIRAWYVTRFTDKKLEAVLSVFVDRVVIGLLGTLSIAVFFWLFLLRGDLESIQLTGQFGFFEFITDHKWSFSGILIAVAVVFCGFLFFKRGRLILERAWQYLCMQGLKTLKRLKQTVFIYFSRPLIILASFGLTVFLQLLTITAFWYLGENLGVDVGLKYYYLIFTLTWVLGALPVSIGGAVVVEGCLAYLFVRLTGVEAESAFALALCQRIVWMVASLPGAAIHLSGAHLPKDFSLDYDKLVD